MTTKHTTLALLATTLLLLWPATALAQTPDVTDILANWGNWPVVVGVVVSLAIELWRRLKPQVFEALSPFLRRLIPFLVAGLGPAAAMLVGGGDWEQSGSALLGGWGTALATGDLLRFLGDKLRDGLATRKRAASIADLLIDAAEEVRPANARQPVSKPPVVDEPPPAA